MGGGWCEENNNTNGGDYRESAGRTATDKRNMRRRWSYCIGGLLIVLDDRGTTGVCLGRSGVLSERITASGLVKRQEVVETFW